MKIPTSLAVASALFLVPGITAAQEPAAIPEFSVPPELTTPPQSPAPQAPAAFEPDPTQSAVSNALRALVWNLDASPEWSARFTSLSYNSVSDTATIDGLIVRSEEPGTEVNFETITVVGYSERPDGTVDVETLRADGGTVTGGFSTVALTDVVIEDLSVPTLDEVVFVADQPIASMMKLYREAVKVSFSSASAADVNVIQTIEQEESRIAYEQLRVEGFANGRVELMRVDSARLEAPVEQQLMTIGIGAMEGVGIDLGAMVHVYDPDSYVGGRGDMVWREVTARASYSDIVVDAPGARVFIDLIELEDANVRQPPENFTEFLDQVTLDPDMPEPRMERLVKQAIPNLMGAWSIGTFTVAGIRVEAPGIDRFAMGDFTVNDLSIEGMRELSFEGLEMEIRGQFATRLERFSIGNMVFGGIDGLKRLLESIDKDGEPDPEQFIPLVGFAEITDFRLQTPEVEDLSLGRFRTDLTDFVGMIPTRTTLELVDLVVPVSAIQDAQAQAMLERFGYSEINFGMSFDVAWEDGTTSFEDLAFRLKDMGSLVLNMTMSGIPLSVFGDDVLDPTLLPNITLDAADMTFTDESIVGNGLELLAETMNAPKDQIRQQFAGALPLFLTMGTAGNPELGQLIRQSGFLTELTPAVGAFVETPGSSITFKAEPSEPVPVLDIGQAAENAPETLIELLGLSVSSTSPIVETPPAEVEVIEPSPMPEDGAADPGAGATQQPRAPSSP